MSKKQSVMGSASASRPSPSEEAKMELNQQIVERKMEELQAEQLAYHEREVEAYRQRLYRIATERARVVAEAAAEAEANLLRIMRPYLLPHNLQLFEELNYSGISDDESSTITTVDSLVDTMEGEEVNQ